MPNPPAVAVVTRHPCCDLSPQGTTSIDATAAQPSDPRKTPHERKSVV
jgi:hypothetical protein